MFFQDPSNGTLELVKLAIERNMERSRNLLLSCHVRLSGSFDKSYSHAIATLIVAHQERFRSIGLWFDLEPHIVSALDLLGIHVDDRSSIPTPVPKLHLFPEKLEHLEALLINDTPSYHLPPSSSSPQALSSLVCLSLEMPDDFGEVARWLAIAPNLQELRLRFYSDYLGFHYRPTHVAVRNFTLPQLRGIFVRRAHYQYLPAELQPAGVLALSSSASSPAQH